MGKNMLHRGGVNTAKGKERGAPTTTIYSGVTWVKKKDEVRASVRPKSLP